MTIPARRDVVVVGAGVAGLTVTATLAAAGLDVLCLEARDRIGGRVLSVDVAGGSLDLGATWFWAGERRVQNLAAELSVQTFEQHCAGAALFDHPAGVLRLDDNPIDVAAGRYTAGAHSLTRALASTIPAPSIQPSSPVTSITTDPTGLLVDTATGASHAAHVVLAIPPALAATTIDMRPGLPDRLLRLAQSTPVWMGAITKIVVQYPDAFWRRQGLAGTAVSLLGPLRELHDMSGPHGNPAALFGFTTDMTPHTVNMNTRVLSQLVRLYGPQAADPIRIILQDWSREAFTLPAGVEPSTNYALFGHPLYATPTFDGRLHWAATETSSVHPGRVEGAIAAGLRATQAILANLNGPRQKHYTKVGRH